MGSNQKNIEVTVEETGDEFTFNATSLVADVRDVLLGHRQQQIEATVWSKLDESAQREQINSMANLAFMLINKIVDVVATGDLVCAHVEVSKFAVDVEKGVVTITSAGTASDEMLSDLAHAKGRQCRLTVIDNGQFNKEKRDVQPEPDQPDMLSGEPPEDPAQLVDDDELVNPETGEITDKAEQDETTAAIVEAVQADEKEADQTELDNIGQDSTELDKAEPDESAEPEAEPIPEPEQEPTPKEEKSTSDGATKLSEEWTEGLEARKADKGPDETPYPGGEQKHHDWSAGYQTADEGIDKLRNEGYQARKDGQAATRCTFKKDSFEHTQWMAGYTLAKSEESD